MAKSPSPDRKMDENRGLPWTGQMKIQKPIQWKNW